MKFSIITPTYKRPDTLTWTVKSVLSQSHDDWEMIVINDNPKDGTFDLINNFTDSRIKYFENEVNSGVNFSRNVGLNNIATDSNYVVFLDDDDYLAPEALSLINSEMHNKHCLWLMTARGTNIRNSTTSAPSDSASYSYAWDYLISKKIKGDATHCINSVLINGKTASVRFPTAIKQAEEWLFYFEISLYSKIQYQHLVTTLTDGYNESGLNLRKRSTNEQLHTLSLIYSEAKARNLIPKITFWIYFFMRFVRSFVK